MKLERLNYDPGHLLEFYAQALSALGALSDRTWHDRLEVIADGSAAKLWNTEGGLHQVELQFVPADAQVARDAAREVFPGCPLTFRLAEALRVSPLPLERYVLPDGLSSQPPGMAVAEKLWRAQFPDTVHWTASASFKADFRYSLVALARCEIQAIDQHWSLHRIALSLPEGKRDEHLAGQLDFQQSRTEPLPDINWPKADPVHWARVLRNAIEEELAPELAKVRQRQEHSLARELDRIDSYFETYERELTARIRRTTTADSRFKASERRAAAKAEHARRRADQIAHHEIRLYPRFEALLLVAERAWRAPLKVKHHHRLQSLDALFVPRLRRWESSP